MMCPYRSRLWILSFCFSWIFADIAVGESPLHERIDAVLAKTQRGPAAPLSSDAAFLRRIFLDLTGRIPSAEATRAFLADTAPDKRPRLIEELFQHPATDHHLAKVFDIMFMERRRDKHVKGAEWDAYLLASMQANKPYHVLAREILAADGVDPKNRAPVKFYLDRDDLSVNLVTRDTARVFFGRDIECAQCHDHPLISDYEQSEYYGLLAFLDRSSLFQPNPKTPAVIAEKAEGLVKFKSVFTGYEGETRPRLPGEKEITEPVFKKGEEYEVKPAKNVRSVPKFSRRAKLAELATTGTNEAFNKNIANRLWAAMMGRGLVNPVDLHHSENPPASPELLELLTEEFVAMNFDIKKFLKQIALSNTYQRSYRMPDSFEENVRIAQTQLPKLEADQKRFQEQAEGLLTQLNELDQVSTAHRTAAKPLQEKAKVLQTQRAAAEKTQAEAKAALEKLQNQLAAKQEGAKLLAEAATNAATAAQKLPDDKSLSAATAAITVQSKAWTQRAADLQKQYDKLAALAKTAETELASVLAPSKQIETELAQAEALIEKADADIQAARDKRNTALAAADAAGREMSRLKLLIDYAKTAEQLQAARTKARSLETQLADTQALAVDELAKSKDQEADAEIAQKIAEAETSLQRSQEQASALEAQHQTALQELAKLEAAFAEAETALAESWTKHFRVASVDPLSPEQLGWSVLEAVGQVEQQRTAALAVWNKQHKDLAGKMLTAEQQAERAAFIEQTVRAKLAPVVAKFLPLFAANEGQPQHEFFATVEQALFFANGNDVLAWLRPSGGNLTDRLRKIEEPKPLAEELYLSILTRRPAPEEIQNVADYLAQRPKERDQAIQEMAWALLTSSEFRFQH